MRYGPFLFAPDDCRPGSDSSEVADPMRVLVVSRRRMSSIALVLEFGNHLEKIF